MPEIPLFLQSYEARSKQFSAQKVRNFYVEKGTIGTKSEVVLYGRPAQKLFGSVGSNPIRGIHTMAGVPYVVSGTEVYTVASTGVATKIGDVTGTDIVSMADNGTQVCIVGDDKGWIATSSSVTQITDGDFRTPSSVTYQDSYFIFSEKNSDIIFRSDALNGLSYDALAFATAEYSSDNLVRMFSNRDELIAFGVNTTEFWYNTGESGLSFAPVPGKVYDVGCLAKNSVALLDNTIYWLGSDGRGGRTVWKVGQGPQRVSTHAIEDILDSAPNPEDAHAFTFRFQGHAFYVLTMKNYKTLVFDASNQIWCEWDVQAYDDFNAVGFTNAFNKRICGDLRSNKLYELDPDTYADNAGYFTSEAISSYIVSDGNQNVKHNFLRVDCEAGVATATVTDPQIMMRWSEDGERFGNWHTTSLGKIGESLRRAVWRRLGIARQRVYQIRITDSVKRVVMGAFLNMNQGRWM